MSALQKQDPSPARQAALDALDESGNDMKMATKLLASRVLSDATLFRLIMEPLVELACREAVRACVKSQRRSVWNEPRQGSAPARTTDHNGPARVAALVAGTIAGLMDFPLPGGKRLADATKGEVEAASWSYRAQADDMSIKGRWLALIAKKLSPNDVVRNVLTEDDLTSLRQEARNV